MIKKVLSAISAICLLISTIITIFFLVVIIVCTVSDKHIFSFNLKILVTTTICIYTSSCIVVLIAKTRNAAMVEIINALLVLYHMVIIIGVTIFKSTAFQTSYNLIPFRTIVYYLSTGDLMSFVVNICGNILPFVPLSLFVFTLRKTRKHINRLLLLCLFPVFIEGYQYFSNRGIFDVDDILLNCIGLGLGTLIYLCIEAYRIKHPSANKAN